MANSILAQQSLQGNASAVFTQFFEILLDDQAWPGDIEIITPATYDAPGTARLTGARTGQKNPEAPQSIPLFSQSGPKIGYIADVAILEGFDSPFLSTYLLVPEGLPEG